ncbi:MAG: AAA family ATPase [Patescibacteria group bacterium]
MKLILKSVLFKSFRTIEESTLNVDDNTTILVGANECGKTNILEAIEFLELDREFEISDVKMNSEYARENCFPDIIFQFELSKELCEKLSKYANYFEKYNIVFFRREGNNDNDLHIEPINNLDFKFVEVYKNTTDVEQKVQTKNGVITLPPNEYTVTPVIYRKNIKLFRSKKIQKFTQKKRDEILGEKLKDIIVDSLPKVFLWKYSNEYYIPKDVPINFYQQEEAEKYQSVINLFSLGGIEKDKIASHLTDRDSVYIINFLNDLSHKVTRIINNTWKQRRNIKLNLHYKGEWLEILVEEKKYQIDPEKRSEGLQWYLSFLINFRSKLKTLKDNIILFDQPGDKLHPGGQRDLLERFEELSKHNQIIYSTHTPFMINKEYPERVRLITRPDDDTIIINELNDKDIFKDELLRNSLGLTLADIAPVAEKNILVEGLTDKAIILEFIKKLKKFKFTINLSQTTIVPAHGVAKIIYHANFLKSNGLSVIALFDDDTEGKNAIIANKKKKILDNKEILTIGTITKSNAQTIEDVLPLNIIKQSVNEIGEQYKKGFKNVSLRVPVMPKIKGHFITENIEFTDEIKFLISKKVISKFAKLVVREEGDLKKDYKALYEIIKAIKKKI